MVGVLIEVPVMLLVVRGQPFTWLVRTPRYQFRNLQGHPMSIINDSHPTQPAAPRATCWAPIRNSGEEPIIIEYLKTPPDRDAWR